MIDPEKYINEQGETVIESNGMSMWPAFKRGHTIVHCVKPAGRLKKYDIPIYKRGDGKFVMHRVMAVTDGGYVMCGDNQTELEYGITDDMIIAVAKGFFREARYIDCEKNAPYRLYCKLWCVSLRLRAVMLFVLRNIARAKNKIKRKIGREDK